MSELLAGRQAVREALRAGRRQLYRLWLEGDDQTTPRGILAEIVELARARKISIRTARGGIFERLNEQRVNYQGVVLETGSYPYCDVESIVGGRQRSTDPFLLLLDHLQDPQNLGTLIRTAEAVGVDGVIIPERRAAGITPAVSNASAGAVEHLSIAQVTNLNRLIDRLKGQGIWVAGMDSGEGARTPDQVDLRGPLAIVVGSEGSGLSRLARDKSDFLIRLPMYGSVESLNAAVAGSIVLYLARSVR